MSGNDIKKYEEIYNDNEKQIILVYLNVICKPCKVRTSWRVVSRGEEYLQRLNSIVNPEASDFVFTEIGCDKRLSIQKCYIH